MSGKEAKIAAPSRRSGETADRQEKSTTIRQQNMAAVKGKIVFPFSSRLIRLILTS